MSTVQQHLGKCDKMGAVLHDKVELKLLPVVS